MKIVNTLFRVLIAPFIFIAAIILFALDSVNVNVNPILKHGFRTKAIK